MPGCSTTSQLSKAEMARQDLHTDVLERTGILSIQAMLRQLQLRRSGHLVRMDDARQPKQLFYEDVVTGARQTRGAKRRYKDTFSNFLKRLNINPDIWVNCSQNSPAWRREVKTDAAIYEANCIATAAKAKMEARRSPVPRSLRLSSMLYARSVVPGRGLLSWPGRFTGASGKSIGYPCSAGLGLLVGGNLR
ncbi:hypothetical protein SprV_0301261200 [Sparganum proliferum]